MSNVEDKELMENGNCDCGCPSNEEPCDLRDNLITMVDEETGEEFQFTIVDDFEFEGEVYCVLLTIDEDPDALIVKSVTEEGSDEEFFMSLEEEEYERVAAEYERLLEEAADEE